MYCIILCLVSRFSSECICCLISVCFHFILCTLLCTTLQSQLQLFSLLMCYFVCFLVTVLFFCLRAEGAESVHWVLPGPAQGRPALCGARCRGQHGRERSPHLLLRLSEFHTVRHYSALWYLRKVQCIGSDFAIQSVSNQRVKWLLFVTHA